MSAAAIAARAVPNEKTIPKGRTPMRKRNPIRSYLLVALLALASAYAAQAQTYAYSILYNFQNNGTDPANPNSVIIDSEGNLYGTSTFGGSHGNGAVFELSAGGTLSVLHSFTAADPLPNTLARDQQGNLYGTTAGGPGTIFELVKDSGGTYTLSTLYSETKFRPQSVTLDVHGNLYGTEDTSCLCVFEVPAGGHWINLYTYGENPFEPIGNVLVDPSGTIYFSMQDNVNGGESWVTELYVTLFGVPARYGSDSLARDNAGNIYGLATIMEDDPGATGIIFKIDTAGNVSTVFEFPGNAGGNQPLGPFAIDAAHNVFGTVTRGKGGSGVVFRVSPAKEETVLQTFTDGANHIGVVMDANGNLYGTSTSGGSANL
jgi:uncharacterized repeat protein (TIGR03803 family)